jgi:hypothetical protein
MTDITKSNPISLPSSAIEQAQYRRQLWLALIPAGHGEKDILQPEYYAHFAKKLRPRDRIEMMTDDGNFLYDLMVTAASDNHAQVIVLRRYDLTQCRRITEEMREAGLNQFTVAWHGPGVKYGITRVSNGNRVKDGFAEKSEAENYLKGHVAELIAISDKLTVTDDVEEALEKSAKQSNAKKGDKAA